MESSNSSPRERSAHNHAVPATLPWQHILVALMTVSLVIATISLAMPWMLGTPVNAWKEPGRIWLDVGQENNIPTWWNSSLLMLGAVGASLLTLINYGLRRVRPGSNRGMVAWCGVAILLILLGLDEIASVHERLDRLAYMVFPEHNLTYAWLIFGIPLGLICLAFLAILATSLPVTARRLMLGGLAVTLLGAVGLELIHDLLDGHQRITPEALHLLYHGEEFLEFLGASSMAAAPISAVQWSTRSGQIMLRLIPRV